MWSAVHDSLTTAACHKNNTIYQQSSHSNKEIKFKYIPGWIELIFQDISDAVYHTGRAVNYASKTSIYFTVFGGAFTNI